MLAHYIKRGSHNAFFYGISSAFTRGVGFVFLPYFLSQLALHEFGIWDFYQMFFSMGTMLLTSCAATGMIRFFLLYKDDPIKQQQAIGNGLIATFIGAVLFPLCAYAFFYAVHPAVLSSNCFIITLFNVSFFSLFSMVLAFVRMQEKLMWYTLLFCGQNLLATGLTVLLVSKGYGIQAFFYATMISFVAVAPLFFFLLYRYHHFSTTILKEQFIYSLPLLVTSFIYIGFYSVDKLFIKYDSGFEALGVYGILGRFGAIYQFFAVALMDAWPIILFNAQKEEKGDQLISKLLSYFLLVLTTGGLGVVVASSLAMHWFLAEKYWDIAALLSLYFLPLVMLEVARLLHAGFALSTKTALLPMTALFGLVLQGALLWVLCGYGLPGIMIANSAAFALYGIVNLVMSKKSYGKHVVSTAHLFKTMGLFIFYSIVLHRLLATNAVGAQLILLLSWPASLWFFGGIAHDEKEWVYTKIGRLLQEYFNDGHVVKDIKNILYLRTNIDFKEITAGGSVAHTLGVINGFKEMGYKVMCASSSMQTTLQPLDLDYFQELKLWPIFIFLRWKLAHLRWRLECFCANFFFTVQLLKVIKKHPLQFVYQRYSLLNCVGLIISKLKGVPLVLEYNGSEVWVFDAWSEHRWFKLNKLSHAVERLNLKHANFIVVVSQPLKDDLVSKGIEPTKILVNPNGVDPAMFDPEKLDTIRNQMRRELGIEEKFVFGFIGTFSYWHGIEVLAHIIPLLAQKNKQVHFLLIGDGPLKNYIVEAVTKASVMSAVTFTGLVPQHAAKNYLAACDAFLCPTQPNKDGTRFFGSPTKMFEYMSMGKPIIASDLEQLHEVLSEECGILVKAQNFDGFYEAAQKLLELDAERIKSMGSHARAKVVAHYSWKKHVENIQKFVNRGR